LWRVRRAALHRAAWHVAVDRGPLRRAALFAKVLGTASGFRPRDADPTRWAVLACWPDETAAAAFERGDSIHAESSTLGQLLLREPSS